MIVTNYTDLKTEIVSYADRGDLTASIPGFIRMAEMRIRRDLDVRDMEARLCLPTIAGTQYYGLPARYRGMRHIHLNTSPISSLDYLTPQLFFQKWAGSNSGKPVAYSIIGDEIALGPVPDGDYEIEMFIYQRYAELSDANPVNWLITDAIDLLLYACNLEAALFIKDNDEIKKWGDLFEVALDAIKKEDAQDRHSGGALMITPDFSRF